jgi:succinate dehydrogenase hydrophobic anchor subunit
MLYSQILLWTPGLGEIIVVGLVLLVILAVTTSIFKGSKAHNQPIALLPQVVMYIFALVPLGIFLGAFIALRKIDIDGIRDYKFSEKARLNAKIIIVISVISTILSL